MLAQCDEDRRGGKGADGTLTKGVSERRFRTAFPNRVSERLDGVSVLRLRGASPWGVSVGRLRGAHTARNGGADGAVEWYGGRVFGDRVTGRGGRVRHGRLVPGPAGVAGGDRARGGGDPCRERGARVHASLADQTVRAAASVHANIAEGAGHASRREYLRYARIAHASLAELESHVALLAAAGIVGPTLARAIDVRRRHVQQLLRGLIRSLGRPP